MRLDFFDLFRWTLACIATVYATVVTIQSGMGWYAWLRGNDKYISLARRYLIVHGLRLRVRTFGGDVLVCGLLCLTFLILWYAHVQVEHLGNTLRDLRRPPPRLVARQAGTPAARE
jgi:hypothetical protein